MENNSFKVEDVFGDVISKDIFSQKQITNVKNFRTKNDVNINIKNFFYSF